MPNLKAIRKRIVTTKNTWKITRAMKLVAAARLRRAQENILRLRPYALQTIDIISSLAALKRCAITSAVMASTRCGARSATALGMLISWAPGIPSRRRHRA